MSERLRVGGGERGGVGGGERGEFRDVVFEDVVFDNNRFYLVLYLYST